MPNKRDPYIIYINNRNKIEKSLHNLGRFEYFRLTQHHRNG